MHSGTALEQIRENERKSHIEMYSKDVLYTEGSWLNKPIKTVLDLFPYFENNSQLRILDLGCGAGRNCIAIAQHFQGKSCTIDCVDILALAIEKLNENAAEYNVAQSIHGIVQPIEDFPIAEGLYDWIIAVSALEHVDSQKAFIRKLAEIRNGIRENGIVCLVINSNVREYDKLNGNAVPAQFEVNLPTEELLTLLNQTFSGWEIIKSTVRKQQYDIPRGDYVSELHTDVVTFAAKR